MSPAEAGVKQEMRALVAKLGEELTVLHVSWAEYRVLYGDSEETVDLLNRTAPGHFAHVEAVMWQDTLLRLCRITDPSDSGDGRENLTVQRLAAYASGSVREEIERRAVEAEAAAKFARDWRNRRIAHRDLLYAMDPASRPLKAASRASVENALRALRAVVNEAEQYLGGSPRSYENSIEAPGGAAVLVRKLRRLSSRE